MHLPIVETSFVDANPSEFDSNEPISNSPNPVVIKQSPTLKAAHYYIQRDWPVIPLRQGLKTPAIAQGFKAASIDSEQINQWFAQSTHNIGIATGQGLLVLDIDRKGGKDGEQVIQQLAAIYGDLPETLTIRTPTGGEHRYFSYDPSQTVPSRANVYKEYGEGLDIRADGGYVVAPPSYTDANKDTSGRTASGVYASIKRIAVASLPKQWLDALIQKLPNPNAQTPIVNHEQLLADMQSALEWIPADDYDLWIAIGKACYSIGHAGLAIWDNWSQSSAKYQAQNIPLKWSSFASGQTYAPAFIFDQAASYGWQNPAIQRKTSNPTKRKSHISEPWLAPEPLIESSLDTPYPLHALPNLIGDAVQEVVDIVKCPPAIVAGSALSVLATAIQGIANVQPHRGIRASPLSLYALTIAESGERKTTADNFFSLVLSEWEQQMALDLEAAIATYKAELTEWQHKKRNAESTLASAIDNGEDTTELAEQLADIEQEQPDAVRCPSILLEDTTPESLAFELHHTWSSGGILSSEAGVVFGGHGMKIDSIQRNLATLNKFWEGGELKVIRRGSASFKVRDARLSMGLAVQPSMLQAFYASSGSLARGSGFFARFLMACPQSTQGTRFLNADELLNPHPKLALNQFYTRLHELLMQHYENGKQGSFKNLPNIILDREASEVWLAYFNAVEAELHIGGDMEHAKDVASKSADNAARLAGIFHVFNHGDVLDPINGETMRLACQLASWYLYEARRFFEELALPEDLSDAVLLDDWLISYQQTKSCNRFSKRTLRQYVPNRLRDAKRLDSALKLLESSHRIRAIEQGRSTFYEVNPALLVA